MKVECLVSDWAEQTKSDCQFSIADCPIKMIMTLVRLRRQNIQFLFDHVQVFTVRDRTESYSANYIVRPAT